MPMPWSRATEKFKAGSDGVDRRPKESAEDAELSSWPTGGAESLSIAHGTSPSRLDRNGLCPTQMPVPEVWIRTEDKEKTQATWRALVSVMFQLELAEKAECQDGQGIRGKGKGKGKIFGMTR